MPLRPPASALIQRSERSVDSTQTRTVSPDRRHRDDHRERHAESHRQRRDGDPVLCERAAEEAGAEAARSAERAPEKPSGQRRPARTKQWRGECERRDDEDDRDEPEEREAVDRPGSRGERRRGAARARRGLPGARAVAARRPRSRRRAWRAKARRASPPRPGAASRASDADEPDERGEGRGAGRVDRVDARRRSVERGDGPPTAAESRASRRRGRELRRAPFRRRRRRAPSQRNAAKIADARRSERPQRRDLGAPAQDRDRDRVRDEEHPDEKRQRAERVQVEPEGAHHAIRRRAAARVGGSSGEPGREPAERSRARIASRRDAGIEHDVHAVHDRRLLPRRS